MTATSMQERRSPRHPPVVAVLAGGKGRRFGRPKVTAPLGGRPLASYPIGAARDAGLHVVMVGGPRGVADALGLPWIPDVVGPSGPAAGLLGSLRYADSRGSVGAILLGADMPLVSREFLATLGIEAGRSPDEAAAIRTADGRLQTLGAYYPASQADRIAAVVGDGAPPLGLVFDAVGGRILPYDSGGLADVDVEAAFLNVNTPEDLALAEAWLERGDRAAAERSGGGVPSSPDRL